MSIDIFISPVDYIVLAGQRSPKLADVMGAVRKYDYAVRQQPFAVGARQVFKRSDLIEFTVRLRFYTLEHMIALEQWRPLIDMSLAGVSARSVVQGTSSTDPNAVKAMSIWHPLLVPLDVNAVVVTEVSQVDKLDDTGAWFMTIGFREYRDDPKPSLQPVKGAIVVPPQLDAGEAMMLTTQAGIEKVLAELAQ